MISLVPIGLGAEPAAVPSAPIAPIEKIKVQAISLRDALIVGIVTGFALAAGNLVFSKVAKRMRWQ